MSRRLALLASLTIAASALTVGVSGASITPVFGYGTPAYETAAAPGSFLAVDNAGEPSIGDD